MNQNLNTEKQQTLIFGHSHVWSIKRAIESGTYKPGSADYSCDVVLCGTREFPGPLVATGLNGHVAINACLIAAIQRHEDVKGTWLVSATQGNYYNIVGLMRPEPLFDFTVPTLAGLHVEPEAQFLPYDLVVQMLKDHTTELQLLLKHLPSLGFPNIIHINAPPPIESEEFIMKDLESKGAVGKDPALNQLTPALIRLKLWAAQSQMIEDICRKYGVHCIQPPEETRDAKGFLKDIYWKDSVHANEAYSALLLEKIESLVRENKDQGA